MHPLLLSRTLLAGYLFGWVAFGLIFFFSARVEGAPWDYALWLSLLAAVLAAVLFPFSYYSCRALPLRSTRPLILAAGWTGSSMVMGGLWAALLLYGSRSFDLLPSEYLGWQGWLSFTFTGVFMYLVTVAMHYVVIAQQQAEELQRTEHELRTLAREAELKALRAQLNPHFLFNSLNSISALTSLDPKGARTMCVLLSDFLRKSLKLGERPLVTLAEELDLVKAYLSIEQIRFGARLQVEWEVEAEAESVRIPTLLLQPLVENAIKHGIANLVDGGVIRIAARRRGDCLDIEMENARDAEEEAPKGLGLGLSQVRQRLKGRYGAQAFFEAQATEGAFRVRMAFPMEPDEEHHV
jgi:signal transduction histidine kinase